MSYVQRSTEDLRASDQTQLKQVLSPVNMLFCLVMYLVLHNA